MRLLTYNILKGGQEREAQIVEVIRSVAPDVVVVQEVLEVNHFRQIATALGMSPYLAQSQGRLPLRVGLLRGCADRRVANVSMVDEEPI
jgi:endonuclease/exonuclease/phosphatase family metal-dependent hydrolase